MSDAPLSGKAIRQARYRAAHPDRIKKTQALWNAANRQKKARDHKVWREKNRHLMRATCRRQKKQNPELFRAHEAARRARKAGAGGTFTVQDLARIYTAQGGQCFYCDVDLAGGYQADHRIPLSRGGTNWPDNICCCCALCNQRKHAYTDVEFLAMRQAS